MSAQNIIEFGFNVDELEAEQKQVLQLFVDLFGKLKEYDGTKFNPLGGGGLADLKKSMNEGAAAMDNVKTKVEEFNKTVVAQAAAKAKAKKATDDLTESERIHEATLKTIITTKAKISEADTNAANDKAIELNRLKNITAEVNANARAYLSEIGSLNEARATVKQLTIERDKLNLETEEGKARALELNAAMDKQNEFIRLNSSLLEKQKINIGNYNGAALILQESIGGIGEKLNQMAAAGNQNTEVFQKLTLEQNILKVLLEKQAAGFSSVTQETRAMKNALDTLTVAELGQTETFEKLNTIYTTSKQKLTELHNEQAILTSEAPAFTALAAAARGLGGAYAIGAGASALFADGNEKVEKELQKLVAVMTFLQGLEEAVKALKDRGAIATALQASATGALNTVKAIEAKIFGQSAVAQEADTVAKTINTEAAIGNTAAVEGSVVATELNTVALEGTVVASEAATVATIGFRTALISTGIGAIVIAIIYGITKLVGVIGDWINADERQEEANKKVTASTAELLETTKELNEVYKEYYKERIEGLQREGALVSAAGKNQFIILDNEKQVAEARLSLAKKYLDQKKIDDTTVNELYGKQVEGLEIVAGYEEQLRQAQREVGEDDSKQNKKRVEALEKLLESAKANTKNVISEYNIAKGALKELADAESEVDDNRVKTAKAAADELAKITADGAQRRYDNQTAYYSRILNLETSTEAQKLTAIKGGYSAEVALAGSQIEAVKKQAADKVITEAAASNEIANIRNALNLKYKASLDEQVKIRLEYNDRLLTAENAISRNKNDSDASVQDAITKDLEAQLDDRLTALKRNIADKTQIISDDYYYQLTLAIEHGKTQAEIDQLASDRDKALVELTSTTQKQIYDITISYGEKRLKFIQDLNKATDTSNDVTTGYNAQTDALNTALINQAISYRSYVNQKRDLDLKYILDKDRAEIADDEARLARIRDFEIKELNIKLFFAEKALDAAKVSGDDNEIAKAQAKVDGLKEIQTKAAAEEVATTDKLNKDKQKLNADTVAATIRGEEILKSRKQELEHASFDFAQSLVDAGYENTINKIQAEIDENDRKYDAQIAGVQRSTLNARDQAAQIIILEANQKARDTQLRNEQKQEKIAEAKFDRDMAVARIAWNTAEAVMKDIAGVPWPVSLGVAAADIALGAIQAAIVLSKPIPTYAEGTDDHPGGLAIVGEGKYKERVTIPGQDPFVIDRAMLLNLPANTQVLPLSPENIVADLGGSAISAGARMANVWPNNNNWEVISALDRQTGALVRAYKKSQSKIQNTIHVHLQDDSEWISKKITGKKR